MGKRKPRRNLELEADVERALRPVWEKWKGDKQLAVEVIGWGRGEELQRERAERIGELREELSGLRAHSKNYLERMSEQGVEGSASPQGEGR